MYGAHLEGAGRAAEVRGIHRVGHVADVDSVQEIEGFGPHLEPPFFGPANRNGKALGQSCIHPGVSRPTEVIARQISRPHGIRKREHARGKRSAEPCFSAEGTRHIAGGAVGTLPALAVGVEIPSFPETTVGNGHKQSPRLEIPDAVELPSSHKAGQPAGSSPQDRQVPNAVQREDMRDVIARPVHLRVVSVRSAGVVVVRLSVGKVVSRVVVGVRSVQLPTLGHPF